MEAVADQRPKLVKKPTIKHVEEVPELDEAGEQDHRDEHHDGRIHEFLVFLETLDFRVGLPRPARFAEFAFYLTQKTGDF